MLPRPHPSSRRRSVYGPQLCALVAALLLLLSLFVLHSRLSSSSLLPRTSPEPFLLDDDDDHEPSPDSFADPLEDRIDELDVLDEDAADRSSRRLPDDGALRIDADGADTGELYPSAVFWDHALGVARRPFGGRRDGNVAWLREGEEVRQPDQIGIAFGSDDEPVDEDVRVKLGSIRRIEDALLLKVGSGSGASSLRLGWERWLEAKADFLRKDRMLRSNLELLNPKNHPLLQDPDGPWLTALTRGDRLVQRALLNELEKTPFVEDRSADAKGAEGRSVRSDAEEEEKKIALKEKETEKKKGEEKVKDVDHGRRWGYFPGLDPHLEFSEFMDQFLGDRRCSMRVFMVWNSPPWTYGVRHQRGLESLLRHHRDACVVMLSETMELDFFRDFAKDGFRVAVAMPNLDELLEGTPTHIFATVWFEWRKTRHYSIHYSELIRLAVLYKYGGIYLDSDVIVLNHLNSLQNSVGIEEQIAGNSTFSGAVMVFSKHSPFLMECLKEFHSTYDDTLLKWNGADLMTRVINRLSSKVDKSYGQLDIKIKPTSVFYPISSTNITRYFAEPADEFERVEQEALFMRMVKESITFHLWNSITSTLVPEPGSLVERLLNHYCLHCFDVL
ncbi:uncharacterized protein At4g19900 [Typha latifolia]|uniref:uncharacterized protein At4g19900 n=1 Tax=Typha latifolia TaxID=4733 RepID=UPI003C2DEFDA